ncbi:MAG: hypothetical protein JWO08_4742, partial [Verrucomicrobiaceae bacterium]|nr:hypothetical protein [Verrucomicrobiaceae bacterium]
LVCIAFWAAGLEADNVLIGVRYETS